MKVTRQSPQMGKSLWLDNSARRLVTSGTLERHIRELSTIGFALIPSIFDRAIRETTFYDHAIRKRVQPVQAAVKLFFDLVREDPTSAADLLKPIHDVTNEADRKSRGQFCGLRPRRMIESVRSGAAKTSACPGSNNDGTFEGKK